MGRHRRVACLFSLELNRRFNTKYPHIPRNGFVLREPTRPHFTPQHWPLCHMGLYKFEFELYCGRKRRFLYNLCLCWYPGPPHRFRRLQEGLRDLARELAGGEPGAPCLWRRAAARTAAKVSPLPWRSAASGPQLGVQLGRALGHCLGVAEGRDEKRRGRATPRRRAAPRSGRARPGPAPLRPGAARGI